MMLNSRVMVCGSWFGTLVGWGLDGTSPVVRLDGETTEHEWDATQVEATGSMM